MGAADERLDLNARQRRPGSRGFECRSKLGVADQVLRGVGSSLGTNQDGEVQSRASRIGEQRRKCIDIRRQVGQIRAVQHAVQGHLVSRTKQIPNAGDRQGKLPGGAGASIIDLRIRRMQGDEKRQAGIPGDRGDAFLLREHHGVGLHLHCADLGLSERQGDLGQETRPKRRLPTRERESRPGKPRAHEVQAFGPGLGRRMAHRRGRAKRATLIACLCGPE